MSDELEQILSELESQINLSDWKTKELITKEEYLIQTNKLCNEIFNNYLLTETYPGFKKFKNHKNFEKYLFNHSSKLDYYLEKYENNDCLSQYFISIDARVGIKKDKQDDFKLVFFKIKTLIEKEKITVYYALPNAIYELMNKNFNKSIEMEKNNEGMFV